MARTAIYDSTSADQLAALATIKNENPETEQQDITGLDKSGIDTIISNLETGQDDIYILTKSDNANYVAAVAGTAVAVINFATIDEIATIFVTIGSDTIPIGSIKCSSGLDADAAVLFKNSINAGTSKHGFSADNVSNTLTVSAPKDAGSAANSYSLTSEVDNGGSIQVAITTDFNATGSGSGTGVDGVAFNNGQLQLSQVSSLDAKVSSGSATELYTSGGKNTCYRTWETIHPNTTVPLLIAYLGGYNVPTGSTNYTSALQALIPIFLNDAELYQSVWKDLLNQGTVDANLPVPKQNIELLEKITGQEFEDIRDTFV